MNKKDITQNRSSDLSQSLKFSFDESIITAINNSILSNNNKTYSRHSNFQSIVEFSNDLIWEVNEFYQFIYTNSAFSNCLGYSTPELHLKFLYDYMNKNELIRISECLSDKVNEDCIEFDNEFINRDGEMLSFETKCVPVFDKNSNTIGLQGISRKINVNKTFTETKKNTIEELLELNNNKSLVLDIIAHDLKNPAYIILAMSQLMLDENPYDENLQLILSSSERLVKVIEYSIQFSQVLNNDEIKKEELLLKNIVTDLLADFYNESQKKKINIECNFSDDFSLWANPLISEVIRNYISNALKYSMSTNKIIIEAYESDSFAVVKVNDFGLTIAESNRETIFQRRVQLSENHKIGKGIGLSIVKAICEAQRTPLVIDYFGNPKVVMLV